MFHLGTIVTCWFLLNQKFLFNSLFSFGTLAQEYEEGFEDEYDIDIAGENAAASRSRDNVAVTFVNSYKNEPIALYWVNKDTQIEESMGIIPANGESRFNSFLTHLFTAKTVQGEKRIYPYTIEIVPGKTRYFFSEPPLYESSHQYSGVKPFFQYLNVKSYATSAKFRSLAPYTIDVWYDNGAEGSYQGSLNLGQEYTVNTYENHVFYFTQKGNKSKELVRYQVSSQKILYIIQDPENPAPEKMLEHQRKEEAFLAEYENRTGLQWRHYVDPDGKPRGPPSLFMWPADKIGDIHSVISTEGQWVCLNDPACQVKTPVNLTLEVISVKPKAFLIRNFLTHLEADEIINTAIPLKKASYVGNKDGGGARKSETRTSNNAWVPRSANAITESLFRRAEHLLNITTLDRSNTEDMQVVHYTLGQKYDSHHDWGVSGYPESRYLTLLLYLTDMASPQAGGETAFPKGAGGRGFKVHPGKGSAVLFYNLLEDGNGDDLALHAALPVNEGEKWLANFWVWDPRRK